MDQLICASLSHPQYWYEVGMLKVPAVYLCRHLIILMVQAGALIFVNLNVTWAKYLLLMLVVHAALFD